MKISLQKSSYNILIFSWVLLFLLLRPSVLASVYNKEIFLVLTLLTVSIVFLSKKHLIKLEINKIILYLIIYANVAYFLFQGLLLSTSKSTVLNSSFFIGALVFIILFMSPSRMQKKIVDYFVSIHFLLALSAVISFLLLIFFTIDQLSYFNFDVKNYSSSRTVLFPFTIVWSKFQILGLVLPRFSGIYKEPGLTQAFLATAFWFAVFTKRKAFVRIILFVGILLTFSTAGLLNIVLSFIVYMGIGTKLLKTIYYRPLLFLIISLLLITIFNVAYSEIDRKQTSISGQERLISYTNSIHTLHEYPIFGTGYYSSRTASGERKGDIQSLGLLGAAYQLGYIGLILYLSIWLYTILIFNKGHYLYIYIPFFITLFLFQPNYNDPIIWLLLTLNLKSIENSINRK